MKTLSLALLIVISACASRSHQEIQAHESFKKTMRAGMDLASVEKGLGEPTRVSQDKQGLIYFYDDKTNPIFIGFTSDQKIEAFGTNQQLVNERIQKEAAQRYRNQMNRMAIGDALIAGSNSMNAYKAPQMDFYKTPTTTNCTQSTFGVHCETR